MNLEFGSAVGIQVTKNLFQIQFKLLNNPEKDYSIPRIEKIVQAKVSSLSLVGRRNNLRMGSVAAGFFFSGRIGRPYSDLDGARLDAAVPVAPKLN